MTKGKLWSLVSLFVLTFSTNVFANSVYLGGARSIADCQLMGGQAGFQQVVFGGFVNGIYYWNACFGQNRVQSGTVYYDIEHYEGDATTDCIESIEEEIEDLRCREIGRKNRIECRTRDDYFALKEDLKFVRCVRRVWGPYSTPNK